MSTKQAVILVILDGFGINPRKEGNAIANASMPNMDRLLRTYPNSSLSMSGIDVGLPDGQMGNSEVGHMILGAGRIIYQDLTLIHKDIDEGGFYSNKILLGALRKTRDKNGRLHLIGLLGDGGVHSHQRHMEALIEMARREKIPSIYLHLFLDGRDTPPTSAEQFMLNLNEKLKAWPTVRIATVSGRYYAMDRDKRWDRVEKAYLCLTEGIGTKANSALDAVRESYKDKVTDEFVLPAVIDDQMPAGLIRDGDGVIFFNFRADRARELTRAITDENFKEFPRPRRLNLATYTTMTQYDETFNVPAAYPPRDVKKILGELASQAGVRQLRIAETERVYGEPMTLRRLVGILVVLGGLGLIISGRGPHGPRATRAGRWGVRLVVYAAAAWALSATILKPALRQLPVLAGTALRIPMAGLVLWLTPWTRGTLAAVRASSPDERWRLATVCLLNAVGSVLFTIAIRSGGVAIGNALASTAPLFAIPLEIGVLKTRPSTHTVVGAVCTVAGIACLAL